MEKKVLILRNFASKVNMDSYNLQEIGLGKAFVRRGYNCDVVYYTDDSSFKEVIFEKNGKKLTVRWTKAVKMMSNSIYFSLLKKSKLSQYDLIISTEYNQLMTLLLSFFCKDKLYLYHGPYIDNNNKFLQRIYDSLITPILIKRITKVLTKSNLAEEYLKGKGFKSIKTIGVGLDIERLEINNGNGINENRIVENLNKYNLLYIGVLEDRRNVEFLFKVFARIVSNNPEINLVLVGDGKKGDTDRYFTLAENLNIREKIIYIKKLNQSQLKFLYKNMDLFIFPTSYDIFGMVLLESMYFRLPVVSTVNGGSLTLINQSNGIVLDELDEELWSDAITSVLTNVEYKESLGENAHKQIINSFTWDKVVDNILS